MRDVIYGRPLLLWQGIAIEKEKENEDIIVDDEEAVEVLNKCLTSVLALKESGQANIKHPLVKWSIFRHWWYKINVGNVFYNYGPTELG